MRKLVLWLAILFPASALAATLPPPTASPGAGTYTSAQSVTLTDSTGGATICYTVDGSTPTAATAGTCDSTSLTYSAAIAISTTTTLKAIATKAHDTNSSVMSALYTINIPAGSPNQIGAFIVGP